MSISSYTELVRQIHDSSTPIVLSVTGGGSGAISDLLRVPGASRTVLEATVPYASEALTFWLGAKPERYCAPETASAMAMAGFMRALRLLQHGDNSRAAGIACTASLASDRPKQGAHRAYAAWQTSHATGVLTLELAKGRRSRSEEEGVVSGLVLNAVASAAGLTDQLQLDLLANERVETTIAHAQRAWTNLLLGAESVVHHGTTRPTAPDRDQRALFPGAFNPLHAGHRRIAECGARILAKPVEFELSISNVDKPPLDFLQIQQRTGQFIAPDSLWLTRAPTFVEKSAIFPGTMFLVGVDTIVRIADPKYYGDEQKCLAALKQVAQHGCGFLVFGRSTPAGFQTLSDVRLPEILSSICREVPATDFREDISSTELRRGKS